MRISTSKMPPSTEELVEVLRKEFSGKYSYKLFGMGSEKSIMVYRSSFVGVQITKAENEFTIQGTPSVSGGYSLAFLELTGIGALLALMFGFLGLNSSYRELEKEVAVFLKRKYS